MVTVGTGVEPAHAAASATISPAMNNNILFIGIPQVDCEVPYLLDETSFGFVPCGLGYPQVTRCPYNSPRLSPSQALYAGPQGLLAAHPISGD